jgi:WD40 repeat protein
MEFVKLTSFQDENFVHDISFDFYGKRFATCSTDGRIKIWDLNEDDGTWNFIEISEAHNGCIWRLSWSHPEFGNLIASCSEDTNVHIWEEQVAVSKSKTENREKWLRRVQLTDSKKPVNDVKFAPRYDIYKQFIELLKKEYFTISFSVI